MEATAVLEVDPGRVFKTLIVSLGNERLAVASVPVRKKLDLKAIAVAVSTKKAAMADNTDAERATAMCSEVSARWDSASACRSLSIDQCWVTRVST